MKLHIPADPKRKKLRELEQKRGNPQSRIEDALERIELKLDLLLEKLETK